MRVYRTLFTLAMVLFLLCLLMCFIVDIGSAEFVIMVIASVINLALVIFSIIKIKKDREK